jgi:DNA polymerase-1
VTGRLSARNPNLQNIPAIIGPMIREAFVATPGWTLIEADYSQLELRIAGWYSNDKYLIDIYNEDKDIHSEVAMYLFNKEAKEISGNERRIAKTVNFGVLYGKGASSFAVDLQYNFGSQEISDKPIEQLEVEAQQYIDGFLSKFSSLRDWIKDMHKMAVTEGYTQTPFGRKRRYPFIDKKEKSSIERKSVNTPIQSLASDLCLKALTVLHKGFNPKYQRVLMPVHDSIMVECRIGYEEETKALMKSIMEKFPLESPLPFRADFKRGLTWGSMEKE